MDFDLDNLFNRVADVGTKLLDAKLFRDNADAVRALNAAQANALAAAPTANNPPSLGSTEFSTCVRSNSTALLCGVAAVAAGILIAKA